MRSHLLPLLLAAIALPTGAGAQTPSPELFQRRDATGTELERAMRPDLARVQARLAARARGQIAGAPTVEVRRNYVYVQDSDGTLRIPYQNFQDVQASFEFGMEQVYRVLPDEFDFIYFFTSFQTGVGAYFYSPFQNDDSGIGQPRFDQSGTSPLEGFIFMNYWRDFEEQFGQFGTSVVRGFSRSVFNQEAGHRWGVDFGFGPNIGDMRLNALLGRDESHWSYFADTGGSPMEGNSWRDNGNGTFTSRTDVTRYEYSDVDLYLMGLLGPEAVRPWFLIENPDVGTARDITNRPPTPSSPPQIFDPVTIRGTRADFTIDDLSSRLGQRFPVAGDAPNRWRVVFVLLAGRNNGFTDTQKIAFETTVDGYIEGFRIGTRNLGDLDATLVEGPPLLPIGAACTMVAECNPIESNVCTTPSAGGASFCTRSCSTPQSCPTDWCCGLDGTGSDNVCQPPGSCGGPPPPDAGMPDGGEAPGADAGSGGEDAGTGGGVCACDLTFSCDPSCSCDPECSDGGDRDSGCSCQATETTGATDAAGAILLLLAIFFARPRRMRE